MFLEIPPEIDGIQLEHTAQKYQSYIQKTDTKIQELKEQKRKLTRIMLNHQDHECFLRESIHELQVSISGKALDDVYIGSHKNYDHIPSKGRGDAMRIELGDNLSFLVPTERLLNSSTWKTTAFSHLIAKDIHYVRLSKEGRTYTPSFRIKRLGCGLLWLGSCEVYDFYETNLWQLQSLTMHVNQVPIYHREQISFSFDHQQNSWIDAQLTEYPLYDEMLNKGDCLLKHLEHNTQSTTRRRGNAVNSL